MRRLRLVPGRPGAHPTRYAASNQQRQLPSILFGLLNLKRSLPNRFVTCCPLLDRCVAVHRMAILVV